jgi:NitT/TauT family transport system substrate-binding protein
MHRDATGNVALRCVDLTFSNLLTAATHLPYNDAIASAGARSGSDPRQSAPDEGTAMRYDVRRGIRAPLLLVAALGLLAAACSGGSDTGSSGSSGGPEISSITIGSLPVVDAAPAYVAEKAGYFKQEGLTVKFQQAQGGAALIPSLVSGDIQVAFSNWVSLFLAKSHGIDLTLIADGDKAKPGFSGVFVMPNSPIKTPADLAGKKIAVNTLNNVGGLVISAVLKSQGVDPKTIKFVEVGFPDMGATLQRGDVDAVWVVEPFTSAVKATLNARPIIDPFSGPTAALPVGGYAVTKQFADKNPKTVAAFARALDKAVADSNADRSKVDEVVPTYIKIDAATASKVTLPIYSATPNALELQRVADLMQQFGNLSQRLDVASFTRSSG